MDHFRRLGARITLYYLPPSVFVPLETILAGVAVTRGIDYLGGVTTETAIVALTESLLDAQQWGGSFLFGGLLLTLGLLLRRHLLVWAAHLYLAMLHIWFMIGGALVTVPLGEYRVVFALLLPAALHFMLAWHLGATPRRAGAHAH